MRAKILFQRCRKKESIFCHHFYIVKEGAAESRPQFDTQAACKSSVQAKLTCCERESGQPTRKAAQKAFLKNYIFTERLEAFRI